MSFQTRHGEALNRILAAYPPGPGLIAALETYCRTIEEQGARRDANELAATVCEGLHHGEAQGLKCLKCYMAEQHFTQEAVIEAEIEAKRSGTTPPPDSPD
jgi:hypothetical protein